MLASSVLITAGTPDSMYLEDRQEKWLRRRRTEGRRERGRDGGMDAAVSRLANKINKSLCCVVLDLTHLVLSYFPFVFFSLENCCGLELELRAGVIHVCSTSLRLRL